MGPAQEPGSANDRGRGEAATIRPPVHFIGVGGQGMSALALVLLHRGCATSGSDVRGSERTERLRRAGARIELGHDPAHLGDAATVVYSTDVPADNPELAAARRRGLPVLHRSEVLAELIAGGHGVAVTGTHGKTTTTSLVALALLAAGRDPTVLVGADTDFLGGNARLGGGPHVVAEADESDGSFRRYRPRLAVVTNLEPEHLEHYGGRFDRVVAAFRRWLGALPPGAAAVLCADDPRLRELAARVPGTLLYGLGPEARLSARRIEGSRFIATLDGRDLGPVALAIPGRHNISNALAALGAALSLGLPFQPAAAAMETFRGARRRFQVVVGGGAGGAGVTVVDDYAHHPTEIRATLAAARERTGGRLIAVFQPHRYRRTKAFMDQFGPAFAPADAVVLADVYAPEGERPIPGVDSRALAERIRGQSAAPVHWFASHAEIVRFLLAESRPGDLVLTMGAGDIGGVAHELASGLGLGAPGSG